MNIEKYLESIQDEMVSSAAGIGFAIDSFPQSKKKKKKMLGVTENSNNLSMRAMIDLDGTIHKYSKGIMDGTIYDDPFPGARETINWLKEQGFEIVIFTTRASETAAIEFGQDVNEQISMVENWLSLNDIQFDLITAEKLNADFYIDDKSITIKNGNWTEVKKEIESRIYN